MKIDYTHHYKKWHDDSEEHRRNMMRHFKTLLQDHLPPSSDAKILDVGCGMGFAMLAVQELGYHRIEGIDCDSGQVAQGRDFGLQIVQSDDTGKWLQSHAGEFDTVLCLDLLEHIPVDTQIEFVRAVGSSLKDGGRLICTVPNANAALSSRWRYIDWTHHTSFTEHSLDFLLHNGGFDQIQVQPAETRSKPKYPWLPLSGTRNWWLWKAFRAFRRLEMIAEFGREDGCSIPLSLNLLATARKRAA